MEEDPASLTKRIGGIRWARISVFGSWMIAWACSSSVPVRNAVYPENVPFRGGRPAAGAARSQEFGKLTVDKPQWLLQQGRVET